MCEFQELGELLGRLGPSSVLEERTQPRAVP